MEPNGQRVACKASGRGRRLRGRFGPRRPVARWLERRGRWLLLLPARLRSRLLRTARANKLAGRGDGRYNSTRRSGPLLFQNMAEGSAGLKEPTRLILARLARHAHALQAGPTFGEPASAAASAATSAAASAAASKCCTFSQQVSSEACVTEEPPSGQRAISTPRSATTSARLLRGGRRIVGRARSGRASRRRHPRAQSARARRAARRPVRVTGRGQRGDRGGRGVEWGAQKRSGVQSMERTSGLQHTHAHTRTHAQCTPLSVSWQSGCLPLEEVHAFRERGGWVGGGRAGGAHRPARRSGRHRSRGWRGRRRSRGTRARRRAHRGGRRPLPRQPPGSERPAAARQTNQARRFEGDEGADGPMRPLPTARRPQRGRAPDCPAAPRRR